MIKKQVLIFIFILIFFSIFSKVYASNSQTKSHSAFLNKSEYQSYKYESLIVNQAIKNVLIKHNSYLSTYSNLFVKYSMKYNIDPYLLVSISGLESSFGLHMVQNSYNAFGWGGGFIYFTNWDNSIETISKNLKTNYYNYGYITVDEIGTKYAESKTWAIRVNYFIALFKNEENRLKKSYNIVNI